jgi:hypothetical protein
MEETVGVALWVQSNEAAFAQHVLGDALIFLGGAVAPPDSFWLHQPSCLLDPHLQRCTHLGTFNGTNLVQIQQDFHAAENEDCGDTAIITVPQLSAVKHLGGLRHRFASSDLQHCLSSSLISPLLLSPKLAPKATGIPVMPRGAHRDGHGI